MDGRHSFVGLVSGGKDSVFSIYKLVNEGHKLVCLANLYPQGSNELDSFMFQSVGSEVIEHLETVMGVPLYRAPILGTSKIISLDYTIDKDDEIEDLHNLLEKIKVFLS
ncbi:Diphthine--ammonia ligase [Thelohanellus kitauei]|uniref:Diphthine--ammonia ligase n=1 Tax=Thelohanellus kitauei TaxID=669202 RepID=A0A0C2JHG5_THEKT|nr:Diphthine--ammonia ligase [Thelohanellus kitauei]